jgi:membrane-bound metal-dependent hydrolase YbcI (DUF457 family)
MAGFQTHITVSSLVGAGYAWVGSSQLGLPFTSCAAAGGLCAIAGTLPDLDSDSGVPARETISFAAAVVPMLLFSRFEQMGMTTEQLFLAGAPVYLFIRFIFGTLLKQITIHRGMFHSIPATLIAGFLAFLIISHPSLEIRLFKAFAVAVGYLTHLVLDEIWSVDLASGVPRLKSSFGTALKMFGDKAGANSAAYGLLLLVGVFAMSDLSNHLTAQQKARLRSQWQQMAAPLQDSATR